MADKPESRHPRAGTCASRERYPTGRPRCPAQCLFRSGGVLHNHDPPPLLTAELGNKATAGNGPDGEARISLRHVTIFFHGETSVEQSPGTVGSGHRNPFSR